MGGPLGKNKQNFDEKYAPMLSPISLEHSRIFNSLQDVPKKVKIFTFFSPMSEILSIIHKVTKCETPQQKLGSL